MNKMLVEENNEFIQIFEENCFDQNVDVNHVHEFITVSDSWSTDENGKQVRHIHKAKVIKLRKNVREI